MLSVWHWFVSLFLPFFERDFRLKKKNQMPFITGQKLKALSERRVVERRRVNIGSWVTSLDGAMVLACQTQDASASGVR